MIEKVLDEYELKARVAPGLILALPILVDAAYAAPIMSSWPMFAASGVCSFALIYGLGLVVRAGGRAIEPELWKSCGGSPSTRIMRKRDSFFGADLKASIRAAVAGKLSSKLLDSDEESTNPARADQAINDAFRQVRQYLREHNAAGLWFKQNVEYGFCRNLLGCRAVWVMIASVATVFAMIDGVRKSAGVFNAASAVALLSLACAIYVGWAVLPNATKRTAERYAELAWMAFLQVGKSPIR